MDTPQDAPKTEDASKVGTETPSFWTRNRDIVRGTVAGSLSAVIVSLTLTNPAPSNASAATLLGPLASIGSQINNYMGIMDGWVDDWLPQLDGLIDSSTLNSAMRNYDRAKEAINSTLEGSASFHAEGGEPYQNALNAALENLTSDDGQIDPEKAARLLSPPPNQRSSLGEGDVTRIWDHALLLVGDEPLKPVSRSGRDTLAGTEYEYKRLQTLASRMLAQDAVQQYPLSGGAMAGYESHVEQFSDPSSISSMTPGQIAGSSLNMMVSTEIPIALDSLESNLRQERLLGALLAQEVKRETETLIQNGSAGY